MSMVSSSVTQEERDQIMHEALVADLALHRNREWRLWVWLFAGWALAVAMSLRAALGWAQGLLA